MLECVNVLVLGASKSHDFTNQHIYAIKIQSSNQTIELSIDINCHEYMAITLQFEFNPNRVPCGCREVLSYDALQRYSVTVRNSPLLFLLMGSGSWNLGWGFCFSGIEDFLYQQD